jgi:dsRNA-specific ribonuclease
MNPEVSAPRGMIFQIVSYLHVIEAGNGLSSSVGSNRNLDRCGRENGLDKFITPHPSFVEGTIPPRTMSATVEALIGAVFLDSGENLEAVKRAMKGLGLLALPETADTPKQNPLS